MSGEDSVAVVTMNRPEYRNAQNSAMTYALDEAFTRAVDDPRCPVIVLAGAGDHFSAGHDIGSPGRDVDTSFERKAVMWWDHVGREGGDLRFAREMEVYLGMCRRWREIPEADDRDGAGRVRRGRTDARVGLRPDRGGGGRVLRRSRGAHGDSGRRVLRAPVGARAAGRQGGAVHRRPLLRSARVRVGHGVAGGAAFGAGIRRRSRWPSASRGCRRSGWRWRRRR